MHVDTYVALAFEKQMFIFTLIENMLRSTLVAFKLLFGQG